MVELQTRRWRRYGKDRLYVTTAQGEPVGWQDLLTGRVVLDRPDLQADFTAALAGHHDGDARQGSLQAAIENGAAAAPAPAAHADQPAQTTGAGTTQVAEPGESAPTPPEGPSWTDLALNVPGQAARHQAHLHWAVAKEQGRLRAILNRVVDTKTDERSWRVGANGEEAVGERLNKLTRHGWHVLHAVPVGNRGSDIDHVVIGPGGVFTINTKTHPEGQILVKGDSIRVNGHGVPYLRNARFEADRAAQLLSTAVGFPVTVRPVLVFLTGTLIPQVTITKAPTDVVILDRTDIPGEFRRARTRLRPDDVDLIYAHARRSTTWTVRVPTQRGDGERS